MSEMALQMFTALALVILLILGFGFFYRKRHKGNDLISVVTYQSLGQKIGIAAVKVGGEILVLGITPNDFKLLQRFDADSSEQGPVKAAGISGRMERLKKIKEGIDG
ncbi:MAG: flagellar biosynthetic protein FliO [Thermodesulfovibrionales bacterium]